MLTSQFFENNKKNNRKFLVGRFSDDKTEVIIEKAGGYEDSFKDMLEKYVPKNRVSFIAYNCDYTLKSDGGERSKLILVAYSDDSHAPLKEKMLSASTIKEVEKVCKKASKYSTINDRDELTEEYLINLVSDNRTK